VCSKLTVVHERNDQFVAEFKSRHSADIAWLLATKKQDTSLCILPVTGRIEWENAWEG
jgi:hypothetical protein